MNSPDDPVGPTSAPLIGAGEPAPVASAPSAASPPAPAGNPALGLQSRLMVVLVGLLALAVLFWPHESGSFREPGGFLLDSGGRATTLGPHLAPVSLVHFWATWCPPCIEEAPALSRLARDFSSHREFAVVMVAVADSRDRVGSLLGNSADRVLFDPKWDVAHRYGTEKLPETYLVVNGRIVEKFIGETDWDRREMREKIAAHLPRTGDMAGS
jgi:thiol-disulfide isomerase/thioredoxin